MPRILVLANPISKDNGFSLLPAGVCPWQVSSNAWNTMNQITIAERIFDCFTGFYGIKPQNSFSTINKDISGIQYYLFPFDIFLLIRLIGLCVCLFIDIILYSLFFLFGRGSCISCIFSSSIRNR